MTPVQSIASIVRAAAAVSASLWCTAVLAHHPTGSQVPQTTIDGLLSGLGHPIIDVGHLAFVVAFGLFGLRVGAAPKAIATFLLMTLAGLLLHAGGVEVPAGEAFSALSALMIGLMLLSPAARMPATLVMLVSTAAGLVHGSVYGSSMEGADTPVLLAYLVGVTAMQGALLAGICVVGRARSAASDAGRRLLDRLVGGSAAATGVLLLVQPAIAALL